MQSLRFQLVVLSESRTYFTGAMSPSPGDTFKLSFELPNVIGRHKGLATICIKDSLLARKHCEIVLCRQGDRFSITCIDARNLPSVNGTQVMRNESVPLAPGDTIRLGRTVMRLQQIERRREPDQKEQG